MSRSNRRTRNYPKVFDGTKTSIIRYFGSSGTDKLEFQGTPKSNRTNFISNP